ncbi:hypothetical protein HELRODRAFT_117320 [Helobdella robusta]|uniref:Ammonium transporter AmtB-like domain-containing protein n=1 Tax=Helobdella robusta TaxID=6412 RepID=T1EGM1_HELRO|nr:hypothetical protein HELRODRAFT_117320 [Helobdella robusta]ESO05143.1 hypothetical protein HELRODRAFT_117320 [Helobdella robusta]
MLVHMFGAYFGLMVALFTARPGDVQSQSFKELSVYHSDIFTMIGTLFLWLFWPSFNSVFVEGEGRQRSIINSYLALLASVVVAATISALVQKNKRFTMIHIQNATLAGGVVMGTMGNLIVCPWVALLMGTLAGGLTVLGYHFITPCCNQKLKIHDTRGVHNLHALPAILSAIGGIVCAALASHQVYGDRGLLETFPAIFSGRTSAEQAEFQLAALAVTMAISLAAGVVTG